jgi:hypothetical protein
VQENVGVLLPRSGLNEGLRLTFAVAISYLRRVTSAELSGTSIEFFSSSQTVVTAGHCYVEYTSRLKVMNGSSKKSL